MQRRDASVPLANYNGTNIWYYPGAEINSTEAFHGASHLEEEAYLANRYMFIGLMIILLGYVLAQLPYTYVRMEAYGFWHGLRLSNTIDTSHEGHRSPPKRLRHHCWPIPVKRIPFFDLPLSEFLLVGVLWAAGVGVAGWCQATFLTDASRSTLVVMSLTALSAALGIKAGGIGTWVVHGYTAVNFLHRWTGRLVLLLSTLHVIAYLVVFYQAGIAKQEMSKPENYLGAMAYGGLLLTGILSMGFIRRRWWLLFKFGHHIGVLLLLAGLNYHSQDVVPYLLTIWGLLIINTIVRSVSTRMTTANITPLLGASSILATFPFTSGFTPGQHVRMRLLVPGLWRNAFESHPFTIAAAEGQNVSLVVKVAGDWTKQLYELALVQNTIKCSIEGPYGGPLNFIFPSYRSVVVVAGGSGISFALGVLRGVLAEVQGGRSKCQHTQLIWTVKQRANILNLAPILSELIISAEKIKTIDPTFVLDLHLHYTATATSPSPSDVEKEEKAISQHTHQASELDGMIFQGRPNIKSILSGTIAGLPDGAGGMGIGVCGPSILVDNVERIVRAVLACESKRVGGVDLHAERFSL